jgi:predicted aldo/keto reductase-like oxidoreductase
VRPAVWKEFERLRSSGKTRSLGFSSHNRKLAAALAQELPVDVVMIRYNAAHRGAEREVFPPLEALGERRPGIISYTATRWGMLLRPLPDFPKAMSGPECYRFVLGYPLVDATWCAPGTLEELKQDILGILEGPLEPERAEEVRRFGDAVHAAAKGGYRWMFRE